jgi:hypothetical protein
MLFVHNLFSLLGRRYAPALSPSRPLQFSSGLVLCQPVGCQLPCSYSWLVKVSLVQAYRQWFRLVTDWFEPANHPSVRSITTDLDGVGSRREDSWTKAAALDAVSV